MSEVIAISNQKGGVGKTTTAVNLAVALCASEQSVLLIDLDPQSNATSSLSDLITSESDSDDSTDIYSTICDFVSNQSEFQLRPSTTSIDNFHVVRGSQDCAAIELEMGDLPISRTFLRQILLAPCLSSPENSSSISPRERYDWIILDTPPGIGLLTVNALAAASIVISPVQSEYLAVEGLSQLLNTTETVKNNFNSELQRLLVLITMYDSRLRLSRAVREEIEKTIPKLDFDFSVELCSTQIPRNIRLAEAPSFGKPVMFFDPGSSGSTAYIDLAREVYYGQETVARERTEFSSDNSSTEEDSAPTLTPGGIPSPRPEQYISDLPTA